MRKEVSIEVFWGAISAFFGDLINHVKSEQKEIVLPWFKKKLVFNYISSEWLAISFQNHNETHSLQNIIE